MAAPTNTDRATLLGDRLLKAAEQALDMTARVVQRAHTAVHERQVIRDARRGSLGERRGGVFIREHAKRLSS